MTLRTASAGVITGVHAGLCARAGETAPLLFTAFGNQFWNLNPNQPTAALPLQIFTYAISPFDDWHRQAWAGALILIVLIVVAVAAVRIVTSRGHVERERAKSPIMGVGIEVRGSERLVRQERRSLNDINMTVRRQPGDGRHRSLGLRQVHLCALPEPDA